MLIAVTAFFSASFAIILYRFLHRTREKTCHHPFDYQIYPLDQKFKLCMKCRKAWEWKNNRWQEIQ